MGGGGKGGGGGSNAAEEQIAQEEVSLAQNQQQNSNQLFSASFPGFQQSENYYQQLASGDPAAISRAIAPAAQQINQQSTASAQRISQDAPRGGEKNLALEENQINKGAQIGQLASGSYLNSFNSLAGLAGQGIGQAQTASGQSLSGLNAAGNQYSNIAQQQQEGSSSTKGTITSALGTAATVAAFA